MDLFWKAAALALVTAILSLAVGNQEKHTAILLGIAGCCLIGICGASYLKPILNLVREVEAAANIENGMLGILLKTVGITLTAEIAGAICSDAGNSSLSKMLQILCSGAVLFLAIPIFQSVWTLLTEIMEQL